MTYSEAFLWMEMFVFWVKFHEIYQDTESPSDNNPMAQLSKKGNVYFDDQFIPYKIMWYWINWFHK